MAIVTNFVTYRKRSLNQDLRPTNATLGLPHLTVNLYGGSWGWVERCIKDRKQRFVHEIHEISRWLGSQALSVGWRSIWYSLLVWWCEKLYLRIMFQDVGISWGRAVVRSVATFLGFTWSLWRSKLVQRGILIINVCTIMMIRSLFVVYLSTPVARVGLLISLWAI